MARILTKDNIPLLLPIHKRVVKQLMPQLGS